MFSSNWIQFSVIWYLSVNSLVLETSGWSCLSDLFHFEQGHTSNENNDEKNDDDDDKNEFLVVGFFTLTNNWNVLDLFVGDLEAKFSL